MDIDLEDIDIERLRNDLMDYFGTAGTIFPMARFELFNLSSCSDIEIIDIAVNHNFDLSDYLLQKRY